jgi:hypothetical protein
LCRQQLQLDSCWRSSSLKNPLLDYQQAWTPDRPNPAHAAMPGCRRLLPQAFRRLSSIADLRLERKLDGSIEMPNASKAAAMPAGYCIPLIKLGRQSTIGIDDRRDRCDERRVDFEVFRYAPAQAVQCRALTPTTAATPESTGS